MPGHVLLTPSTEADTRHNGNRGAVKKGFLRPRPGPCLQALVRNHAWTTGLSLAPSCSKVSQCHCFYGGWDTACLPPSASGFQDTQHRPSTGVSASYKGPSGAGRGAGGCPSADLLAPTTTSKQGLRSVGSASSRRAERVLSVGCAGGGDGAGTDGGSTAQGPQGRPPGATCWQPATKASP